MVAPTVSNAKAIVILDFDGKGAKKPPSSS
jgi:hypothetical protein